MQDDGWVVESNGYIKYAHADNCKHNVLYVSGSRPIARCACGVCRPGAERQRISSRPTGIHETGPNDHLSKSGATRSRAEVRTSRSQNTEAVDPFPYLTMVSAVQPRVTIWVLQFLSSKAE